MAILTVGAGQEYSSLTAAISASKNGDTIEVQAGTYTNQFAVINDNITIEGVGGMANLVATEDPSNGKAILVTNGNDTIENLSFSGAKVPDDNGAGIRDQKGALTLINDYFHNNQEGVLTGNTATATLTIEHSEFANNGNTSGLVHNLYVGNIGSLTVTDSLFTGAIYGNEIQSRALTSVIEDNRIQDGPTADSSYEINLPNGGNALIEGNVIEKGPHSQQDTFIHFGGATAANGGTYANSSLTISGNTIVNDLKKPAVDLLYNSSTATPTISDNEIYGLVTKQLVGHGTATVSGNTFLTTEPTLSYAPPFSSGSGHSGGVTKAVTLLGQHLASQATTLSGSSQPLTLHSDAAAGPLLATNLHG